mmetsp:Transcript_2033/g.3335  ORF Transcript_2033/g.3335 Transcript_2033/m.3335 type:complete len:80 (+) Transcript_2033:451-690(+)
MHARQDERVPLALHAHGAEPGLFEQVNAELQPRTPLPQLADLNEQRRISVVAAPATSTASAAAGTIGTAIFSASGKLQA